MEEKIDEGIVEAPPPLATEEPPRRYRSLFWPIILIGVGVIWFLVNLGVIEEQSLFALLRLWPVLLIVAGLDVMFGRQWPALGGLIGLVLVGSIVVFLILAPSLGFEGSGSFLGILLGENPDLKSEQFTEPVAGVESAVIDLDLSRWRTTIEAAEGGDLFTADLDYLGDLTYEASGGSTRHIRLGENFTGDSFFSLFQGVTGEWNIGLSPAVPLTLFIGGGSGMADIDLSGLDLRELDYDMGSGFATLALAGGERYPVRIQGGSGSLEVRIPADAALDMVYDMGSGSASLDVEEGADFELSVQGGSGSFNINLPSNAAVRVEVLSGGSGSMNVSNRLDRIDDRGDNDPDTGIWQTPGFDSAQVQIVVIIRSVGSGSVNIR